MVEDLINALRRIAKVSYGATIEEARSVSKTQREAADMLEQQAARLTALESERDALLAAAGKDAVAVAERPFNQGPGFERESYDEFVGRTERTRQKFTYGAFTLTAEGTEKAREFLIGYMRSGMGNGIYDNFIRYELAGDFAWNLANGLAAAPTAALEKGDGRDAEAVARHALAATDSDRIALIRALQKALAFWMPKVFDERSAHDAYLLIGYEGDDDQRCWGDEMVSAVSRWTPVSEQLPAKPGWYLAMLAPDNDWGLMSDTPLQVEFDAYISKPKAFTCFYDYRGDEDISAAVTHWQPLPEAPAALSQKAGEQQ